MSPEEAAPLSETRSLVVSFRVTVAEKAMLEVVSELKGDSLSYFVRDSAMKIAWELMSVSVGET